MSTFRTINDFRKNPRQFIQNATSLGGNLISPEWIRQNPLSAGVLYASMPMGLASGALSVAATANDDENLYTAANVANWIVDPVVDTASEYVTNKHMLGMSNRKAAATAGGSMLGVLGGQYAASQMFDNDPTATFIGGYVGDTIGDVVASKAIYLAKNYLKTKRKF